MPKNITADFFDNRSPIAVVAGGAGFIGSRVCEFLLEKSVRVVCVDNWQTGLKENIDNFLHNSKFLLLEQDINESISPDIRADYVFHLAGIEAYLNGEDLSIQTLEANSVGTRNLVAFAQKQKARFLLASTINVYSAGLSASDTSKYFGRMREEEGEFSYHEAKRFAEALVSEYGQKKNVDVRIVRLGDVYGPGMILATNNHISRLLKQALYKSNLEVSGKQEVVLYPVYVSDAVEGIVKSMFSGGTKSSIISLTGPKTTLFDVAQKIKTKSPDLEIKFIDKEFWNREVKEEILHSGQKNISWSPRISLEEGLSQTIDWFVKKKNQLSIPRVETRKPPKFEQNFMASLFKGMVLRKKDSKTVKTNMFFSERKNIKPSFWSSVKTFKNDHSRGLLSAKDTKPNSRRIRFFVLFLLLVLPLCFFVFPFVFFGIGMVELLVARDSIKGGEYLEAKNQLSRAGYLFLTSERGFLVWSQIPGLKNESVRFSKKSKIFARTAGVGSSATGLFDQATVLFKNILSSDDGGAPFPGSAVDVRDLEKKLGFLETETEGRGIGVKIPFYKSILVADGSLIDSLKRSLGVSNVFLAEFENLLGKDKKTYLILLQDNDELRPGGGVIRAIAFVTFEHGRLTGTEVHGAASADGQLKGHVEPPSAIKSYLKQENWYLRDSNWSPDFPTSAEKAIWFIDKELSQKVDGVAAIDFEFVKNFLGEFGGIQLDGAQEAVDKTNVYQKMRIKDSSVSDKDPAASLLSKMISVIVSDPAKSFLPFSKAAFWSLRERHVSVWANNQNFNSTLNLLGWSGAIRQGRCVKSDCIDDYLALIEANLGGNKSNAFLERNYSLETTFDKDKITHKLLVAYKNKSAKDWPGGEYKNYVRIFVPRNSRLVSAALVDAYSGQQDQLVFEQGKEKNKEVFGLLALIPAGASKELVLVWEYLTKPKEEVVLTWQKQSGTLSNPVSIKVSVDGQSIKPTVLEGPSLTPGVIGGYNTVLSQDLVLDIPWQNER